MKKIFLAMFVVFGVCLSPKSYAAITLTRDEIRALTLALEAIQLSMERRAKKLDTVEALRQLKETNGVLADYATVMQREPALIAAAGVISPWIGRNFDFSASEVGQIDVIFDEFEFTDILRMKDVKRRLKELAEKISNDAKMERMPGEAPVSVEVRRDAAVEAILDVFALGMVESIPTLARMLNGGRTSPEAHYFPDQVNMLSVAQKFFDAHEHDEQLLHIPERHPFFAMIAHKLCLHFSFGKAIGTLRTETAAAGTNIVRVLDEGTERGTTILRIVNDLTTRLTEASATDCRDATQS